MTEDDVRRIVRSELRRLVTAASTLPDVLPSRPQDDPVTRWLRGLPQGASGTATELLDRFVADTGAADRPNVRLFGRWLRRHVGSLVERTKDRRGVSVYKARRAWGTQTQTPLPFTAAICKGPSEPCAYHGSGGDAALECGPVIAG